MFRKIFASFLLITFTLLSVVPPGRAQGLPTLQLPPVGSMVNVSPAHVPVLLKGMTLHLEDPFRFDFIVDSGHNTGDAAAIRQESERLVKYFLAAMTTPKDDLWVNLSPNEPERIVPDSLARTELGRDLLAQDYLLKQLTASLMYPEKELGARFWEKIFAKVKTKHGNVDIPTETFHKVWILPESATVYEHENTVYVVEAKLKVMLEEEYLSEVRDQRSEVSNPSKLSTDHQPLTTKILRETILPAIEREVNTGANFAPLRQIYHSLILAKWYKQTVVGAIHQSPLHQFYIDQNKISGVDDVSPEQKNDIYTRYMAAYKQGVYDYMKEEYDPAARDIIPRHYFSGGFTDADLNMTHIAADAAAISAARSGNQEFAFAMKVEPIGAPDAAMSIMEVAQAVALIITGALGSQGISFYREKLRNYKIKNDLDHQWLGSEMRNRFIRGNTHIHKNDLAELNAQHEIATVYLKELSDEIEQAEIVRSKQTENFGSIQSAQREIIYTRLLITRLKLALHNKEGSDSLLNDLRMQLRSPSAEQKEKTSEGKTAALLKGLNDQLEHITRDLKQMKKDIKEFKEAIPKAEGETRTEMLKYHGQTQAALDDFVNNTYTSLKELFDQEKAKMEERVIARLEEDTTFKKDKKQLTRLKQIDENHIAPITDSMNSIQKLRDKIISLRRNILKKLHSIVDLNYIDNSWKINGTLSDVREMFLEEGLLIKELGNDISPLKNHLSSLLEKTNPVLQETQRSLEELTKIKLPEPPSDEYINKMYHQNKRDAYIHYTNTFPEFHEMNEVLEGLSSMVKSFSDQLRSLETKINQRVAETIEQDISASGENIPVFANPLTVKSPYEKPASGETAIPTLEDLPPSGSSSPSSQNESVGNRNSGSIPDSAMTEAPDAAMNMSLANQVLDLKDQYKKLTDSLARTETAFKTMLAKFNVKTTVLKESVLPKIQNSIEFIPMLQISATTPDERLTILDTLLENIQTFKIKADEYKGELNNILYEDLPVNKQLQQMHVSYTQAVLTITTYGLMLDTAYGLMKSIIIPLQIQEGIVSPKPSQLKEKFTEIQPAFTRFTTNTGDGVAEKIKRARTQMEEEAESLWGRDIAPFKKELFETLISFRHIAAEWISPYRIAYLTQISDINKTYLDGNPDDTLPPHARTITHTHPLITTLAKRVARLNHFIEEEFPNSTYQNNLFSNDDDDRAGGGPLIPDAAMNTDSPFSPLTPAQIQEQWDKQGKEDLKKIIQSMLRINPLKPDLNTLNHYKEVIKNFNHQYYKIITLGTNRNLDTLTTKSIYPFPKKELTFRELTPNKIYDIRLQWFDGIGLRIFLTSPNETLRYNPYTFQPKESKEALEKFTAKLVLHKSNFSDTLTYGNEHLASMLNAYRDYRESSPNPEKLKTLKSLPVFNSHDTLKVRTSSGNSPRIKFRLKENEPLEITGRRLKPDTNYLLFHQFTPSGHLLIFLVGNGETRAYGVDVTDGKIHLKFLKEGNLDSEIFIQQVSTQFRFDQDADHSFKKIVQQGTAGQYTTPEALKSELHTFRKHSFSLFSTASTKRKSSSPEKPTARIRISYGIPNLEFNGLHSQTPYRLLPYIEEGWGLVFYLESDSHVKAFNIRRLSKPGSNGAQYSAVSIPQADGHSLDEVRNKVQSSAPVSSNEKLMSQIPIDQEQSSRISNDAAMGSFKDIFAVMGVIPVLLQSVARILDRTFVTPWLVRRALTHPDLEKRDTSLKSLTHRLGVSANHIVTMHTEIHERLEEINRTPKANLSNEDISKLALEFLPEIIWITGQGYDWDIDNEFKIVQIIPTDELIGYMYEKDMAARQNAIGELGKRKNDPKAQRIFRAFQRLTNEIYDVLLNRTQDKMESSLPVESSKNVKKELFIQSSSLALQHFENVLDLLALGQNYVVIEGKKKHEIQILAGTDLTQMILNKIDFPEGIRENDTRLIETLKRRITLNHLLEVVDLISQEKDFSVHVRFGKPEAPDAQIIPETLRIEGFEIEKNTFDPISDEEPANATPSADQPKPTHDTGNILEVLKYRGFDVQAIQNGPKQRRDSAQTSSPDSLIPAQPQDAAMNVKERKKLQKQIEKLKRRIHQAKRVHKTLDHKSQDYVATQMDRQLENPNASLTREEQKRFDHWKKKAEEQHQLIRKLENRLKQLEHSLQTNRFPAAQPSLLSIIVFTIIFSILSETLKIFLKGDTNENQSNSAMTARGLLTNIIFGISYIQSSVNRLPKEWRERALDVLIQEKAKPDLIARFLGDRVRKLRDKAFAHLQNNTSDQDHLIRFLFQHGVLNTNIERVITRSLEKIKSLDPDFLGEHPDELITTEIRTLQNHLEGNKNMQSSLVDHLIDLLPKALELSAAGHFYGLRFDEKSVQVERTPYTKEFIESLRNPKTLKQKNPLVRIFDILEAKVTPAEGVVTDYDPTEKALELLPPALALHRQGQGFKVELVMSPDSADSYGRIADARVISAPVDAAMGEYDHVPEWDKEPTDEADDRIGNKSNDIMFNIIAWLIRPRNKEKARKIIKQHLKHPYQKLSEILPIRIIMAIEMLKGDGLKNDLDIKLIIKVFRRTPLDIIKHAAEKALLELNQRNPPENVVSFNTLKETFNKSKENGSSTNPAMLTPVITGQAQNTSAPGGIDMNDIPIDRDGAGIKMRYDPAMITPLLQDTFQGFKPVTIHFTPLPSIMPILGFHDEPATDEPVELTRTKNYYAREASPNEF